MQAAIQTDSGPDAKLDTLYREYSSLVFRSALRVTGRQSDAEDVVQTVFVRLMAHDHVRGLDDNPASYLRRAATNAALDVLRRRKTRRAVPFEGVGERLETPIAGPSRALQSKAIHEALREALTELSPRAASAFTMRFFDGMKNGEIAEALGTSAAVVAVTLHRARRQLQASLQDFAGDMS